MKKDNRSPMVDFGFHGWFHIIYMLLVFWFYVGMVNDGSNNIAGDTAAQILGSVEQAGVISACNSAADILGAPLFIVSGILNRKIGPHYMPGINCIIAGMAYIGVLNAPNTFVYTLMMILICGTTMLAGYLNNGVIVANRFPKKEGIVVGYTTMGHNLATALFVPLILYLVVALGVERACYPISGGCIILGLIGLLSIRDTPFERGLLPDSVPEAVYEEYYDTDEGGQGRDGGWITAELPKTGQMWLCAVTTGTSQTRSVGTMSQIISRTTNGFGFTVTMTAAIMLVCAVVGVVGSFPTEILDQKIGIRRAMILFGCWYALAPLVNFTNTMVGFRVSTVMIGIGIGGSASFTTSFPASIFGRRGSDRVNSVLFPIQGIITALIFAINDTIMTMTGGNVRYAYLIDACLALINAVLVLFFVKDHKHDNDWMVEQAAKQSN